MSRRLIRGPVLRGHLSGQATDVGVSGWGFGPFLYFSVTMLALQKKYKRADHSMGCERPEIIGSTCTYE